MHMYVVSKRVFYGFLVVPISNFRKRQTPSWITYTGNLSVLQICSAASRDQADFAVGFQYKCRLRINTSAAVDTIASFLLCQFTAVLPFHNQIK